MAKRSMVAGLALALLACPVAMTLAKEPPALVTSDHGLTESVMTMRVRGDLTFGTDGVVKEYHVATRLDPAVAAFVDKAIEGLKFKPYLQDGVPVNAKTYFQMTLAAREQGPDKYTISMDHASFTDDETFGRHRAALNKSKCVIDCIVSQPPAPAYMGQVNGGVIVHLYLNPDGTVADAVIGQSALYSVRGRDKVLDDARKVFEKIALRHARGIRFAPGSGSPLVGDNHLVGALPFVFQMDERHDSDNLGKWRLEQRGKRVVASWLAHDPDRWIGVSDTSGGGFVAMKDSPYKLVSDTRNAAP